MKKNQPHRHHYVPEFYQLGFADADQRLWLYDRRTRRYAKVHPCNICCENDLYTIDPDGKRDQRIEAEYLSQIDGDGATAIRDMERKIQLDQDWKESFSIFLAFLVTRSPAFQALTVQNYQAMRQESLRIGCASVDRVRQILKSYHRRTGELSEEVPLETLESIVQNVAAGRWQASVTDRPFLEHMFGHVEPLARWIASFDWQLIEGSAETGFIVCDYPLVVVPSPDHPDDIGFGFPGTIKYFPLTKALCLVMGEPGGQFSYDRATKRDVRIINQNIAVNSERFIMGSSRV